MEKRKTGFVFRRAAVLVTVVMLLSAAALMIATPAKAADPKEPRRKDQQ